MKKKLPFLLLTALVAFGLFFQQCKHKPIIRTSGNQLPADTTKPKDTSICFERDILPLFVNNCAKTAPGFNTCHDSKIHKEGFRLYKYDSIRFSKDDGIIPGDATNSKLYDAIVSGFMNSTSGSGNYGHLTIEQVALIKRWINEGAKDGKNCPVLCDTAVFTFGAAVSKIMTDNCISCHSGSSPSGGASFDNYGGVIASINKGVFWNRIHAIGGSIMPPSGQMNDCKLTQIKKWIDAGTQNN